MLQGIDHSFQKLSQVSYSPVIYQVSLNFAFFSFFFSYTLANSSSQSLSTSHGDLLNTSLKNMFSSAPSSLLFTVTMTRLFPFTWESSGAQNLSVICSCLVQLLHVPLLSRVCTSACASLPSTSILFFLSLYLPLNAGT